MSFGFCWKVAGAMPPVSPPDTVSVGEQETDKTQGHKTQKAFLLCCRLGASQRGPLSVRNFAPLPSDGFIFLLTVISLPSLKDPLETAVNRGHDAT